MTLFLSLRMAAFAALNLEQNCVLTCVSATFCTVVRLFCFIGFLPSRALEGLPYLDYCLVLSVLYDCKML